MDIGTGIFLSAVLLSLVVLFLKSGERTSWRRGLLWFTGMTALLAVLVLGGLYANKVWEERPRLVTELSGVRIGAAFDDVEFRMGRLKTELAYTKERLTESENSLQAEKDDERKSIIKRLIAAQKESIVDLEQEGKKGTSFMLANGVIRVEDGKVSNIAYYCNSDATDYTSLNGVACRDSAERIAEVYGNEVRRLCEKKPSPDDVPKRAYDAVKYGVRYFLEKNSVYGFLVTNPSVLESYVGFNWIQCKL